MNPAQTFNENGAAPESVAAKDGPNTSLPSNVTRTGLWEVSSMNQEMPLMKQMINLCNVIRVCVIVHKRKCSGSSRIPQKSPQVG
jgi:hypothetical protein